MNICIRTHEYMCVCTNDLVELPAECYLWHARDLYPTHTHILYQQRRLGRVCVYVFLVQTVLANIMCVYMCVYIPAWIYILDIIIYLSVDLLSVLFRVPHCRALFGESKTGTNGILYWCFLVVYFYSDAARWTINNLIFYQFVTLSLECGMCVLVLCTDKITLSTLACFWFVFAFFDTNTYCSAYMYVYVFI